MMKAVLVVLFASVAAGASVNTYDAIKTLRNLLKTEYSKPDNRWNKQSLFGKRDWPPQQNEFYCRDIFGCPQHRIEMPDRSENGAISFSTEFFSGVCTYVNQFINCIGMNPRYENCSSVEFALGQMDRYYYLCSDVGEADIIIFLPCLSNGTLQEEINLLRQNRFNEENQEDCGVVANFTEGVKGILTKTCTVPQKAAALRILEHFNIFDALFVHSDCCVAANFTEGVKGILTKTCTVPQKAAALRILEHFNIFDALFVHSDCW